MKKSILKFRTFLLSLLLINVGVGSMAQTNYVKLTFTKGTGTGATNFADVQVAVLDKEGVAISGATATISCASGSTALNMLAKGTGTAIGDATNVICADKNGNTLNNGTNYIYTVSITGLTGGSKFNTFSMASHALGGSGNYQDIGQIREWNVETSLGAEASSVTSCATTTNFNVNGRTDGTSNVIGTATPLEQTFASAYTSTSTNLVLNVKFSQGSSNPGCFYGVEDMVLSYTGTEVVDPDPDPQTGIQANHYYRFRNKVDTEYYAKYEPGAAGMVNEARNATNLAEIWQVVGTDTDGEYYLLNVGSGLYAANNTSQSAQIEMSETPSPYTIPESLAGEPYYNIVGKANNQSWNSSGANGNIVVYMYAANNNRSHWFVEEVATEEIPIMIGETGYASYASSEALAVPSEMSVLYASEMGESSIHMENAPCIPAATGVILNGEPKDYTLTKFTGVTSGCALASNLLSAALEETQAPENSFALKSEDGVAGFYSINTSVMIPAGKAYLVANGASSNAFIFDFGQVTGINSTNTSIINDDEAIYDLQGRKVKEPSKGIYIKGGKKFYVK